ncbi:hypothetical protein B0H14DRAFT_3124468 [Mycena olivaceomarginata]|nr:hypothetical protein B0H14DRAFT_3124468 [Mycena olivaceomarginata]
MSEEGHDSKCFDRAATRRTRKDKTSQTEVDDRGEITHFLETRRWEKDEKAGKSMHELETSRQEKVSKTNMGDGGKSTHWLETRRREKDEKARKSEQDKHGRWGKSMHFLETRSALITRPTLPIQLPAAKYYSSSGVQAILTGATLARTFTSSYEILFNASDTARH